MLKLLSIQELKGKNFFIPDYQRGFRWDKKHVTQLLTDLEAYFKGETGKFYSLQTLVVKRCTNEFLEKKQLKGVWYEVIDGQQRLTTIRIICALLDSMDSTPGIHSFCIHYETRPTLSQCFDSLSAVFNANNQKRELKINGNRMNNIDAVHIYNAAEVVVEWMNGGNDINQRKNLFSQFFFNSLSDKKSVQFIYYENDKQKDARTIFNEINDLTVNLSNAELIRALFLSDDTPFDAEDDRRQQQLYINARWCEMERGMSDPKMLAFISNVDREECRNNIEYLFDLISGKYDNPGKGSKQDPLYTYLYFREKLKNDAMETWREIDNYYSRLCGWMNDRDYYHYIGFLNATANDDSVMCGLLHDAATKTKNEMVNTMVSKIRERLALPKNVEKLDQLEYKSHNSYIKRLLFFYNVESARTDTNEPFFPFDLFKYRIEEGKRVRNIWTLEHIHAQNSECLPNDKKVWKEWAQDNATKLKNMSFTFIMDSRVEDMRKIVMEELETAVKDDMNSYNMIGTDGKTSMKELFDRLVTFYDIIDQEKETPMPLHQLSNLTLLNNQVNASIGCSPFAIKREKILDLKKKGCYFPQGTLNVFNKVFSNSLYLYEWSASDRLAYYNDIEKTVKKYL